MGDKNGTTALLSALVDAMKNNKWTGLEFVRVAIMREALVASKDSFTAMQDARVRAIEHAMASDTNSEDLGELEKKLELTKATRKGGLMLATDLLLNIQAGALQDTQVALNNAPKELAEYMKKDFEEAARQMEKAKHEYNKT